LKNKLKNLLIEALKKKFSKDELDKLVEVQQATAKHIKADFFSNIAMKLAKILNQNPMDIAKEIVKVIKKTDLFTYDIAEPGYINFIVQETKKNNIVTEILNNKNLLGSIKTKNPKKIHLEFVSANPTGPLHIGHGRGAIYGNIIAKFLKLQGHNVHTEYYINDVGRQMDLLFHSIFKNLLSDNLSDEDLYKGEYIDDIAKELEKKYPDFKKVSTDINKSEKKKWIKLICEYMIENYIKKDLEHLDISFDNWFFENSLFDDKSVEKVLEKLDSSGHTKKHEGALMLLADELRPLIKSNGDYTYLSSDLAYHDYKLSKYDLVINIWGADHHGYVPRIKLGMKALGHNIDKLDIHLIQFANLYRGKDKISMSTRKGEFVTLKTLINEIGNDAINFFYLTKKKDQHLDFDLNIAISEDKNNPVYYIQYAYARIEKLLIEAGDYMKHDFNPDSLKDNLEKNLIDSMNVFEETCEKSIINLEPHLMTHYLQKLSQDFHSYYANVKLLTEKIDYNKIYLIAAVQKILKCGLGLLNISAPKQM
tara:strand:+ start:2175 stop:3782 length:1608 start_codon:yes stop_codon:yes gene_type:complete